MFLRTFLEVGELVGLFAFSGQLDLGRGIEERRVLGQRLDGSGVVDFGEVVRLEGYLLVVARLVDRTERVRVLPM